MRTFSTVFMLTGLTAVAAPALAGPHEPIQVMGVKRVGDSFVMEVPYNDLDLRRPAEVKILSARVDKAINTVCSPRLYTPWLNDYQNTACIEGARADAAPQMRRARQRALEYARQGYSSIPEVAIALRAGF